MKTGYSKNQYALLGVLLMAAPVFSGIANASKTYTYANFDFPDQTYRVNGINDSGQIVGTYNDAGLDRSFILSGGNYTTLSGPPPGAGDTWYMEARGINNNGEVVGNYWSVETGNQGFKYSNGSYQAITVPGSSYTYAYGINNNGQVVGNSGTVVSNDDDAIFVESGGVYNKLLYPSPTTSSIVAEDINNSGQVVGNYQDGAGIFAYVRSSDGVYTTLPPGNLFNNGFFYTPSDSYAINDSGQILAYIFQNIFVMFDGSNYSLIINPDANGITYAEGINDLGQVVGNYFDGTQYRGFIATPAAVPIPAAIWLFGSALAGLGLIGKSRSTQERA